MCDLCGQYFNWSHICAATSEYSRFRAPSQGFPKIILMDRYGEFGLDSIVTTVYYRAKAFLTRWIVDWE